MVGPMRDQSGDCGRGEAGQSGADHGSCPCGRNVMRAERQQGQKGKLNRESPDQPDASAGQHRREPDRANRFGIHCRYAYIGSVPQRSLVHDGPGRL
jgi:hypothetical protein